MKYLSGICGKWKLYTETQKNVKIKGALLVSEEEAKTIVAKLNLDKEIQVSENKISELMAYGVDFHFTHDRPRQEVLLLKKQEEESKKQKIEIKLKCAQEWFETLSEEQKEMIKTLTEYDERFKIIAIG